MPSSRSSPPTVQAGLLTPGSSYWLRLPDVFVSDMVQRSSPVTAAGPSLIFTGFPIKFLRTPELAATRNQSAATVKRFLTASGKTAVAVEGLARRPLLLTGPEDLSTAIRTGFSGRPVVQAGG